MIRAGFFWTESVSQVHAEMLDQGFAPTVNMSGLHKKTGLRLRLSQTESCIVRERPEEFQEIQEFAELIGLPYKGNGAASFAFNALCALAPETRGHKHWPGDVSPLRRAVARN